MENSGTCLLWNLEKVFSLDKLAEINIFLIGAPLKKALDVAVDLALWALKMLVSIPDFPKTVFIHQAKVLLETPLCSLQ